MDCKEREPREQETMWKQLRDNQIPCPVTERKVQHIYDTIASGQS